ncbi:MAG: nicotinate-nucleotide adenylyltransferase [bacterium]
MSLPNRSKGFRLGLMGGTFDPIHYGHLSVAEQARCTFRLHQVAFIPSGNPPHKERRETADPEHRYLMTVLATSANPRFAVSRVELDRKGPSYAIDTVRFYLNLHKDLSPQIFFITGIDAVMEILTWRSPEEFLSLCTIISATRPGYDAGKLRTILGDNLFRKIKMLEAPALAISSTDIRSRICKGLPIKYLLPESVEHYIYKNRLYNDKTFK